MFEILQKLVRRQRHYTLHDIRELIEARDWDRASTAIAGLNPLTPQAELHRRSLQAEIDFHRSRDKEAEEGFRAVLKEAPGFADAHYGLSLLLLEQGDMERALEHAQFAKNAQPNEPRFLAQLGLSFLRQGSAPAAERALRQAVTIRPTDKASWNNLGIVLLAKAHLGDARDAFSRALEIDPGFERARENLDQLDEEMRKAGLRIGEPVRLVPEDDAAAQPWAAGWREAQARAEAGEHDAALRQAEALCGAWPLDAELHARASRLYCECGDAPGGIELMRGFLGAHPDDPVALAALGRCHIAAQDEAQAATVLDRAVELGDRRTSTLLDFAEAVHKLERYEQALGIMREVAAQDTSITTQMRLAAALVSNCNYVEALAIYAQLEAGGEAPRTSYLANYTYALLYSGRVEEAEKNVETMVAHAPNDANVRATRAAIRLLQHNFGPGWDDYNLRGVTFSRHFRTLPMPKWDGSPLQGKRIVVLAEQGLGDQVMFASCLPDLLAQEPAEVIVEVIDRVAPTLARSFPQVRVVASNQKSDMRWITELGEVDWFVALGDLPAFFRRTPEAFPGRAYLVPDPARVEHWRERLRETLGAGPWIGVSWRGGMEVTRRAARTMAVTELAPVAEAGGRLVCLQYGDVDADLAQARAAGIDMCYWRESIAKLDDFAALCMALDGVVTVCNTTVHYAGAVGKPVWVVAPVVPEWRYGWKAPRMPWYPDVEVIRQVSVDDWSSPVVEAARRMARRASTI